MNQYLNRAIKVMLLGVAIYGAFVVYSGVQAVSDSLTRFKWWAFAAALGLASFNYCLRFAKWEYYLARLGVRGIPKFDSFLIFLSGFVLTVTPGKVGEVFKSAVLAETHQVPVARTAPIVIAERLTDVIGVIILISLGSLGFQGGLVWAGIGSALVLAGLIFILWQKPSELMLAYFERSTGKLKRLAPRLREFLSSLRILASPSALLFPTALSVVGWGCEGFALWLLLQGYAAEVSVALAGFFYATATLAGAIVPMPGGLGVAEALLQEQMVQLGQVEAGAATGAMLMIRLATLWWAVLVGFGALAWLKRRFPSLLKGSNAPV